MASTKSPRSNQHRIQMGSAAHLKPPPESQSQLVCEVETPPFEHPSERLSKRQGSPRPKKTGELSENRCDGAFSPWSIPKHGLGRINLPAALICSLVTENPMLLSQTTPERDLIRRGGPFAPWFLPYGTIKDMIWRLIHSRRRSYYL